MSNGSVAWSHNTAPFTQSCQIHVYTWRNSTHDFPSSHVSYGVNYNVSKTSYDTTWSHLEYWSLLILIFHAYDYFEPGSNIGFYVWPLYFYNIEYNREKIYLHYRIVQKFHFICPTFIPAVGLTLIELRSIFSFDVFCRLTEYKQLIWLQILMNPKLITVHQWWVNYLYYYHYFVNIVISHANNPFYN